MTPCALEEVIGNGFLCRDTTHVLWRCFEYCEPALQILLQFEYSRHITTSLKFFDYNFQRVENSNGRYRDEK